MFRVPVCSRGIDQKQWDFVSVYSVKRRFCFRIWNINHKLYKPALNLFRHLVNSDDGSLNILPVHCMEHIHLPIFPPLRYPSIPLVDDMVGSISREVCNHIILLNMYSIILSPYRYSTWCVHEHCWFASN